MSDIWKDIKHSRELSEMQQRIERLEADNAWLRELLRLSWLDAADSEVDYATLKQWVADALPLTSGDENGGENARLRQDANRYRYIRQSMTSCNSLHMDGSAFYRLRSPRSRAKSFDEAIDAEMKGGEQ